MYLMYVPGTIDDFVFRRSDLGFRRTFRFSGLFWPYFTATITCPFVSYYYAHHDLKSFVTQLQIILGFKARKQLSKHLSTPAKLLSAAVKHGS